MEGQNTVNTPPAPKHSFKNIIILLFFVFIIVIISSITTYYYLSSQSSQKTQSNQNILTPSIKPVSQTPFVPGEIIVGINSGVKFKNAEQLIKSYNLKYKAPYKKLDFENKKEIPYDPEDIIGERPVSFSIFVSKGEEENWIEVFKSNPIVKYASLNHYYYLQNK